MAKQISQQTFDDVVKENMTEFEMTAEEAVEDAIKQFESQGVSLGIIVKEPSLYIGTSDNYEKLDHPVVAAVKKLDNLLESTSPKEEELLSCLQDIKKECDIDLARRCLAGTNNASSVLFKALSSYEKQPDIFCQVLASYCSLVNGQPDLIDMKGIEFLSGVLKHYKDDPKTEELIIKAIRLNCVKHEANRQEFIKKDLIIDATKVLNAQKSNASLVKEICMILRSLTMDDDIRVPFGKAHESAKSIVTEGDALHTILTLCEEHGNDPKVLAELFLTLSCIVVRNEFCEEVMIKGGLKFIIGAVEKGIKDKVIVRHALIVLKCLAGNDEVKVEIRKLGGVELIIDAMTVHGKNPQIANAACNLVSAFTLRNPENCRKVVDCQGHIHIVKALQLHPNDVGVQKNACMSLRNLVSRTKDLAGVILALGVEPLLNYAMNHHKEAHDEAKAALRDLGCKVELKELWKGQVGNIVLWDDE